MAIRFITLAEPNSAELATVRTQAVAKIPESAPAASIIATRGRPAKYANKPWDEAGISRRTWERRQKPKG